MAVTMEMESNYNLLDAEDKHLLMDIFNYRYYFYCVVVYTCKSSLIFPSYTGNNKEMSIMFK